MAAIRKRPKGCTHPTCQSGECGKCPYNPRSGYSPYHIGADPNGGGGVRIPTAILLVAGVGIGLAGCKVSAACGGQGIGAMFCVVASIVSLLTILEFRA